MRTAQEIFDTAVNHLRQQGKLALSEDGKTCAYRGHDNTMCPVGALIPDESYSPDMEGKNIRELLRLGLIPSPLKEEFTKNLHLLDRLQYIHDIRQPSNFEMGFLGAAKDFHLQYTPPTA